MEIIFWFCLISLSIAEYLCIKGFINVYFNNYNGGPASSSGSIIYYTIIGMLLIIAALSCYFLGHRNLATTIAGLPIIGVVAYMFIWVGLPYLQGAKMN